MATEKLQIVLDAVWKGKGTIQKAQKDIRAVDKASDDAKMALKDLGIIGGAALGGLAVAAKLTFDAMKRGADLKFAERQFDNLTRSIDSTADAMLGRMKQATRNLVSDADLIAGANEIMAGKLAKTEDAVIRLSSVAGALNWDMGVLAQTINNQSVLRLDNLGIAAEDVIPKFNALKDAGMDVKAAFTEALISAGEDKWALVGDRADTAAGKIDLITAALSNVKDEFDKAVLSSLAEHLITAADEAGNLESALITMAQNAGTEIGNLAGQVVGLAQGLQDLANAINTGDFSNVDMGALISTIQATGGFGGISPLGQPSAQNTLFGGPPTSARFGWNKSGGTTPLQQITTAPNIGQYAKLQAAIMGAVTGYDDAAVAAEHYGDNITYANEAQTRARQSVLDFIVAAQDEEEALSGIGGAAYDAADAMSALASATGDYFMQAMKSDQFDPMQQALEAAAAAGANALTLSQFGVAGGLFNQQQATEFMNEAFMRQQADKIGAMIGEEVTPEQAAAMIAGIEEGLAGGEILAADFFQSISDENSVMLNLDPTEALTEVDDIIAYAEDQEVTVAWIWDVKDAPSGPDDTPPPNIPESASTGGGAPGDSPNPDTGYSSNTTIIANTKEAAAVASTMAWVRNRQRF
jgi:hypothetical protein